MLNHELLRPGLKLHQRQILVSSPDESWNCIIKPVNPFSSAQYCLSQSKAGHRAHISKTACLQRSALSHVLACLSLTRTWREVLTPCPWLWGPDWSLTLWLLCWVGQGTRRPTWVAAALWPSPPSGLASHSYGRRLLHPHTRRHYGLSSTGIRKIQYTTLQLKFHQNPYFAGQILHVWQHMVLSRSFWGKPWWRLKWFRLDAEQSCVMNKPLIRISDQWFCFVISNQSHITTLMKKEWNWGSHPASHGNCGFKVRKLDFRWSWRLLSPIRRFSSSKEAAGAPRLKGFCWLPVLVWNPGWLLLSKPHVLHMNWYMKKQVTCSHLVN